MDSPKMPEKGEAMKDLISYIAKALVDQPEQVHLHKSRLDLLR
jgi:hypothetical protein